MTEIKTILFVALPLMLMTACTNSNSKSVTSKPVEKDSGSTKEVTPTQPVLKLAVDPPEPLAVPKSRKKNSNGGSSTGSRSDPSDSGGFSQQDTSECVPNATASDLLMTPVAWEEVAWCWAACGEMIMEKLKDTTISQCDEANQRFGLDICCTFPRPDTCINGGFPEFGKYGFLADSTHDQALSWEELQRQIDCNKAPFCATWRWTKNGRPTKGGHMMVISGYKTENGERFVYILNPDFDDAIHARWQPYSTYVSGPNYIHWNDYFNIRTK